MPEFDAISLTPGFSQVWHAHSRGTDTGLKAGVNEISSVEKFSGVQNPLRI